MNSFQIAFSILLFTLWGLLGCNSLDAKAEIESPFPKPLGEKIIPLENRSLLSKFQYVEMDSSGKMILPIKSLPLTISKRNTDLYGYAFESADRGQLLLWNDGAGNRDSAGIYLAGRFKDSVNSFYPVPILWLPQFPKLGVKWKLDSNITMELVSSDTILFTQEILRRYSRDNPDIPTAYGFQKHTTLLFKETIGDTISYFHFSRGIGLMAFERSVKGRLLVAGEATTIMEEY